MARRGAMQTSQARLHFCCIITKTNYTVNETGRHKENECSSGVVDLGFFFLLFWGFFQTNQGLTLFGRRAKHLIKAT